MESIAKSQRGMCAAAAACALLLASTASGAGEQPTVAADPHAHHRMHTAINEPVARSNVEYRLAGLRLQRADGKTVFLANELEHEGPVVLDFIFTTCTAICPTLSRTFAELQAKSGPAGALHLMSISIDPQHDTPAVLRNYAQQFQADSRWRFYTGTMAESIAVQRAFQVYRGDKMNHVPLTFIRRGRGQPWVRLEGFASVDALLRELAPAEPAVRGAGG